MVWFLNLSYLAVTSFLSGVRVDRFLVPRQLPSISFPDMPRILLPGMVYGSRP